MTPHDDPSSDERLAQFLRVSTRDVTTPSVGALVARGHQRGRRLRRRRRIAVSSACSVAVVGVVAALFVSVGQRDGAEQGTTDAPVAVAPSPERQGETAKFGVRATQMAETLAGLLPPGATSEMRNWSEGPRAMPDLPVPGRKGLESLGSASDHPVRGGSLVFDDGAGPALISVLVSAAPADEAAAALAEARTLCDDGATCTEHRDGLVVVLEQTPQPGTPVLSSSAHLLRADGFTVQVTTYNAPDEKSALPTRAVPPLDAGQLRAVATDAVWVS